MWKCLRLFKVYGCGRSPSSSFQQPSNQLQVEQRKEIGWAGWGGLVGGYPLLLGGKYGGMALVVETRRGVRENFCHACYFPEIQNNGPEHRA